MRILVCLAHLMFLGFPRMPWCFSSFSRFWAFIGKGEWIWSCYKSLDRISGWFLVSNLFFPLLIFMAWQGLNRGECTSYPSLLYYHHKSWFLVLIFGFKLVLPLFSRMKRTSRTKVETRVISALLYTLYCHTRNFTFLYPPSIIISV